MKKYIFIFITACIFLFSCKKSNGLTDAENKLLGNWTLIQKMIEAPGQPTITIPRDSLANHCFIKFYDQAYGYGNLKYVEDNKDCTWGGGGWKIEGNTKLMLVNLDTVLGDILVISANSLVFKASPHRLIPDKTITYSFEK